MQSQHSQRTQNTSVNGDYNAVGPGAQVIVNTYNTLLQTLPVNLKTLVLPLIEHYAADLFGGREAELAMLNAFLADPEQHYGLLVAPTGLGKTALLVRWLARLQEQPSNWRIIFAPVSIRYQTASEHVTLSILAHNLAAIHNNLEQFRTQDQSAHSLRAVIGDYLRRPLPDGSQLLLVLDGIDEATGWELGPLCAVMPQSGLKILVAARQRADMLRDDWQYQLGWANYPVSKLDLHQLDQSAVDLLLAQNAPRLGDDPAFVEQFYRVSEGDPLTCNLLLKALQSGQVTVDSLTNRPPGLEAFLKDWVNKLRDRRKTNKAIRELLALCAAAYGPLNSDDLQALAPKVFEEQAEIVDAVHDDEVARFIITVGEHTYVFSHQRLREVFLEQIYPVKDRAKLQQRMITYGAEWYADRSQPLPDYLRQFWIAHLREAREWERIRMVLTEIVPSSDGRYHIQPWQNARYNAEGSDTGYLNDLDLLWTWAEEQNMLALALRCALIAASLRSRSGNLSPELLVQLVKVGTTEGKWSPAAALEQIAHMPDPENQTLCLKALIEAEIVLPWERALEIARSIYDYYSRATTLILLLPYLPAVEIKAVIDNVLDSIQGIIDPHQQATALIPLLPHLTSSQQKVELTNIINSAYSLKSSWAFANLLERLATYMTPDLINHSLQLARSITNNNDFSTLFSSLSFESDYFRMLAALIPFLPLDEQKQYLVEVFREIPNITNLSGTTKALERLTPYLPLELLTKILQIASSISNDLNTVSIIAVLVSHLPPDLVAQTWEIASTIEDSFQRTKLITALAPHLMANLFKKSVEVAISITDEEQRSKALLVLIPYLPSNQASNILDMALQIAYTITNEEARNRSLLRLIPYLPARQHCSILELVLQSSYAIVDKEERSNALLLLIPYLPTSQGSIILETNLQVANTIKDEEHRSKILLALIPYLPAEQHSIILDVTFQTSYAIIDAELRSRALLALMPRLPDNLQFAIQEAVLHDIFSIIEEENCAAILSMLISSLKCLSEK